MSSVEKVRRPPALRPVIATYRLDPAPLQRRLQRAVLLGALLLGLIVYGFIYALTTPYLLVPMLLPLGVMVLLIIWALPDMRVIPDRTMGCLFFAFVVAVPLWPNYLAVSLPGLPWITVLRLIGFPMVLCLLICISVSSEFRGKLSELLSAAPWIWRLLTFFAVIMTLSVVLSHEKMASLQKLIVAQTNWIAIYFVSVYVFGRNGSVLRFAYILFFSAAVLVLISLLEAKAGKVLWSGHIPSFLKIEDRSVQGTLSGGGRAAGGYRVRGTYGTALGLAEFFALSMPFLLHFLLGRFRIWLRLTAAAMIPAVFVAILTTQSRLGMVGSFTGLMTYVFLWAVGRWKANRRGGLLALTVLSIYPACAAGLLAATFAVTRLRRVVWGGGATAASNATREAQIQNGLPMVMRNPLGHGIGRAAETLGMRSGDVLTIDNYFLAVALEYGVVGFVVYFGLLLLAIGYAVRGLLLRAADKDQALLVPIASSLAAFLIIKTVFSQQDNHPLVFVMMGAITALAWRARQVPQAGAAVPVAATVHSGEAGPSLSSRSLWRRSRDAKAL